jgi:hypothetical protein
LPRAKRAAQPVGPDLPCFSPNEYSRLPALRPGRYTVPPCPLLLLVEVVRVQPFNKRLRRLRTEVRGHVCKLVGASMGPAAELRHLIDVS